MDEADIVKFDAKAERMFVLHGSDLMVLRSWPAAGMEKLAEQAIEGDPSEMFVQGDSAGSTQVVVFSHVLDQGDPAVAGSLPPGSTGATFSACPGCGYGAMFTKITVLDLTGSQFEIRRELFFEGNYLSSRRHGQLVRAVLRGGFKAPGFLEPNISLFDAWGRPYDGASILHQVAAWQARLEQDIQRTELSDWLPRQLERAADGRLVEVEPSCENYYVPAPGLTDYGMTSVLALDLADPAKPLGGALVLGDASEVYSNAEVLVLAQRDFARSSFLEAGLRAASPRTSLHLFELNSTDTVYSASGFVEGTIHNQFSFDAVREASGELVIRLATTERRQTHPDAPAGSPEWWQTTTVNRVLALAQGEPGELSVIGTTGELAPNETIRSTRFVGDIAYVVTAIEQQDPLFVVDVSDPRAPKLLGEAHISGFSQYMHPLRDPRDNRVDHLLTIGREGDPMTGRDLGLKLQIFDVTDPVEPRVAYEYVYSTQGRSEAGQQHKAFTFYPEHNLLAFPFVSYEQGLSSTLELFRVEIATGFERLGAIDHTGLITRNCPDAGLVRHFSCGYEPRVRRGLFAADDANMDVFVYSISFGGVRVHNMNDLGAAVAEVQFPAPQFSGPFGPVPGGPGLVDPPFPGPVPAEPPAAGGGTPASSSGSSPGGATPSR